MQESWVNMARIYTYCRQRRQNWLVLCKPPANPSCLQQICRINLLKISLMQKSIQQKMFKAVRHWQQSGLTKKAWCAKNKIAYATFHYWYKRYRDQAVVSEQSTSEGFVQLMVNDTTAGGCWCELVWANGPRLIFQQPVSAEFLKGLIA